jgi:hypothetical protein
VKTSNNVNAPGDKKKIADEIVKLVETNKYGLINMNLNQIHVYFISIDWYQDSALAQYFKISEVAGYKTSTALTRADR